MVGHAAAFGRDDDYAVRGAGAVDRGRRGVLEYRQRFDVGRIDRVEVGARNRYAVKNIERCRARVYRVYAADFHDRRFARFARYGHHRQTRYLALQRLVESRRRRVFDVLGLDGRDRARYRAFLADAVGDHHHVFKSLRIVFHRYVVADGRASAGYHEFYVLVADVLEQQSGSCGHGNGVGAVDKRRDARRGSCDHVHSDQRLFVLGRSDRAAHLDFTPPLRGGRYRAEAQCKSKNRE